MPEIFLPLCLCLRMTLKVLQVLNLEVTNKDEFANMDSADEDQLCVYIKYMWYTFVHMYAYKCFPYKIGIILNL